MINKLSRIEEKGTSCLERELEGLLSPVRTQSMGKMNYDTFLFSWFFTIRMGGPALDRKTHGG